MKEPKLSDLKFDAAETKKVRRAMAGRRKVKITINVDSESLSDLKQMAAATGVPYQRLLNKLLQESLSAKRKTESRLDRLERELRQMKRRLAA